LVVQKVNGGTAASTRNADVVIREIEAEAREEQEARRLREQERAGPWRRLGAWQELLSEGQNRRALAIACLLQGLQQLCGFVSGRVESPACMGQVINWCRTLSCTFRRLFSRSLGSRARP
jgi:hypothetical protein